MAGTLLLEIGTEEIPGGYLEVASNSLKDGLESLFDSKRITYSEIKMYFTPRRITALVYEVLDKQKKVIEEVKGPPLKIAVKDGVHTKAAQGFAESLGIDVDKLKSGEYNGKEYVFAEVEKKGRKTTEILEENLPELIKDIKFPKKMRWEGTNFLFARPIRWIVALYDNKIIKFKIAGIKSNRYSRGHRLLSDKKIKVEPSNYKEKLSKSNVIVDYEKRRKILEKFIEEKAREAGGKPLIREELLSEVVNLVEYPFVITGRFDEKFLNLPEMVIVTAMESHQRYFPVKKGNKLLPYFISAVNNIPNENIIKGNENVLDARLEDAKFYWEFDKSIPISKRVEKLSGITWHKKLGTLLDKTERLINISNWIGKRVDGADMKILKKGAKLSKADLTTLMIRDGKEFTNLEGYIGSEYARIEGYEEEVCRVIEEHYKPRNSEDDLPGLKEAAILSIAERIDLLVGLFITGEKPTSSRDPFGMRQAINGLIEIIVEYSFDFSVKNIIEKSLKEYNVELKEKKINDIYNFIKDRLENYLQSIDIRYDIANSVLSEKWYNIMDAVLISKSMMEFRKERDEFEKLVIGQKRVSNILKGFKRKKIDKKSFKSPQEKELFKKAKSIESELNDFLKNREYIEALKLLKSLRPFIDELFDNVMVMTDDEKLRDNRLALLFYIRSLFHNIADFEEIVID